jgi:hypothetical protein
MYRHVKPNFEFESLVIPFTSSNGPVTDSSDLRGPHPWSGNCSRQPLLALLYLRDAGPLHPCSRQHPTPVGTWRSRYRPTRRAIGAQNTTEGCDYSLEQGMRVIFMEEFTQMGVDAVIKEARRVVGNGPTYISFDVDGLDPVYAPGTGTPEIGGITTIEVLALLRGLRNLNLIGGDVVEVVPPFDPSPHFSPAFVARASRCRCDGVHGP